MPTTEHLAAARVAASKPTADVVAAIRWWTWTFNQRRQAASRYRRNPDLIGIILRDHRGLRADLAAYPDDPRVTWRFVRVLCAARRALRRNPHVQAYGDTAQARFSPNAGLAFDGYGAVLAGEINLLARQRAALALAAE